jgi:hypothetical protein
MSKKKITKLQSSEEHNKLIQLFYENSPEERQKLLTNIDTVLCSMLDLEYNDLPWLNPNQHTAKWEKIMENLRLVVGKIEYEASQSKRTVH